jgi:hypothetical protein
MPLPFRIFKLRGDGSLQFVEEAHTLEDAIESARDLHSYGLGSTSFKMKKQESESPLPQAANQAR